MSINGAISFASDLYLGCWYAKQASSNLESDTSILHLGQWLKNKIIEHTGYTLPIGPCCQPAHAATCSCRLTCDVDVQLILGSCACLEGILDFRDRRCLYGSILGQP